MAKKKKTAKAKKQEFNRDPFSNLKGFAVSEPEKKEPNPPEQKSSYEKVFGSFTEEMEMLGVEQLEVEVDIDGDFFEVPAVIDNSTDETKDQTDEELFFAAVNGFSVRFEDHLPEEGRPEVKAVPRRMKQLKQGTLTPDAFLDLHGCLRIKVVEKLRHFLQNAQHQGWQTVLIITGKGLHSEDRIPILRDEAEKFLSGEGRKLVVEWSRAPKQYGGDGALILFLRKKCK
ncbi:MAG: Smr/MutS family protein [Thermodesulfobacteriota bacterium]|nr:Smr/MutS family protein [Thermodesulfobacteriota bacterium]